MNGDLQRLYNRLRSFIKKDALDQDLSEEIDAHLELAVDDQLRRGVSLEEARRQARINFGGIEQAKEEHRDTRGWPMTDAFLQDFRYALRALRRDPSFAIIAILILALGVAANIAVFSVISTLLLRPLPFADSGQLGWFTSGRSSPAATGHPKGMSDVTYTVAAYEQYQQRNQAFQQLTSYVPFFGSSDYLLTGRGEPQQVSGVLVEQNFFATLGVQPLAGRYFVHEECVKGGRPAVLLSYPFWQRNFAADTKIIGQAILLNKQPVTVVGVLPASFDFGSVFAPGVRMDVFVPAIFDEVRNWGNTISLIGRLKPGVSLVQAQAEADLLFPQIKAAHPEWWGDYTSSISTLKDHVSGTLHQSLVVLWCAVGLVLLIVCVNLSNLMLARATARSKEFAMRRALGAASGRIFLQLLTESFVLSATGALLGLACAFVFLKYLAHQGSIALPLLSSVRVDGAALTWTLLIAVIATFVLGVTPWLKLASGNLQESLKDVGQGMSAGRKHERMRSIMVVSEVALACILLIGAGLLLRSFLNILNVDLGFQPSRAFTLPVTYDAQGKAERRSAILREMLRSIRSIPGVESAGISDMLPLGRNRSWGLSGKGKSYAKGENLSALVRIVTPGYLAAMGMQLRDGRDLSWQDSPSSQRVVIINQAAARRFWPNENPIGQIAMIGSETRVVGVITDVRATSLETSANPEMYLSVAQADPEGAELVMRSKLTAGELAPAVIKSLRALNPSQPASELRPLQQIVERSLSPRLFFVQLVTSFAVLGLILASLGIYGVISYSVTRQTQEIGIRMALGATAPQVQLGVMSKTLRLAFIGIAAGIVGSLAATKWISTLLYETEPRDLTTFTGIILLLGIAAVAAGYIPALKASRIDPLVALRSN